MYHCFFRRYVCLSNLKHALPLTARKTVLSHLNGYLREVVAYESRTAEARLFKMRSLDTSSFERDCIAYDI